MYTKKNASSQNSIGRFLFVGISVLLQIIWLVFLAVWLNEYSAGINMAISIIALLLVLHIYSMHTNSAFKMPWLMLILISPVMGVCLYLLLGRSGLSAKMRHRFEQIDKQLLPKLNPADNAMDHLREYDEAIANQCHYIEQFSGFPVYQNTDVIFYAEAVDGFHAQLRDLKRATDFIFLEYHAIEDAVSFHQMKEILIEKVNQGVDVRILYDDVGSIGFINKDFVRQMESFGIQCRIFNPLIPLLNVFMNNRDHRKITVIDGKVGFTGGYNLADEYFNITHPYGQWKDSGVRLTGDAVRSLTILFLEMWNAMKDTDTDYDRYLPAFPCQAVETCFVQPYADSPLDDEPVGENVYMNIIKNAKRYVYFTTPYLIISDEMNRELGLAAKRGVDVRIITPGIPDKKGVFHVTRSYYAGLARQGVRIYEFSPGFIHTKQCVCDDETATVGTINLDYRSLYLHFENGVFLYRCSAIQDIKMDFDNTFPVCREVTQQYKCGRSAVLRISQCILRLFSPLM
ncbi:MAG: cardiolipin synthase [Clostridiales bacterium]|nr:cardiolipin synthase [Clostridiales bacterium]